MAAGLRRVRWRRVALLTLALAVLTCSLAWPDANAEYRGSDVFGNLSPNPGTTGDAAAYPLSAWGIDSDVDAGITNLGGVAPAVAQMAATWLWAGTLLLVNLTLMAFTWAFNLDLLNGQGGLLAPVSRATRAIYDNVIGETWMVAAISAAGLWGIWKALVQRRYTQTLAQLGVSVVCVLVAMFFVYQPERTIGEASHWTNTMSLAVLSGVTQGTVSDPATGKRHVTDHLWSVLVEKPWMALEFDGERHCVDPRKPDSDGFPEPVDCPAVSSSCPPATCREHGRMAATFLHHAAGSDARKDDYEKIKNGEAPWTKADAPAVDIQQAGGATQRLVLAIVVFIGALGAVLLLGALALLILLMQVLALVLLAFASVMLVVGIFPGWGHRLFFGWLKKLATAVFIKAIYSLVLAVVVTVSAALTSATGELGFLPSFGLSSCFFWGLFLYRKQIEDRIPGTSDAHGAAGYMRTAAVKPVSTVTGAHDRHIKKQDAASRRELTELQTEHVRGLLDRRDHRGSDQTADAQEAPVHTPEVHETPASHGRGNNGAAPARTGDDLPTLTYTPGPNGGQPANPSEAPQRPADQWTKPTFQWVDSNGAPIDRPKPPSHPLDGPPRTSRPFVDDLQRERELLQRTQQPPDRTREPLPPTTGPRPTTSQPFADDLRRERELAAAHRTRASDTPLRRNGHMPLDDDLETDWTRPAREDGPGGSSGL